MMSLHLILSIISLRKEVEQFKQGDHYVVGYILEVRLQIQKENQDIAVSNKNQGFNKMKLKILISIHSQEIQMNFRKV